MRKIKLTQGKYALVDDDDYEWLNQWKWGTYLSHGRWIVSRVAPVNKKIFMGRLILDAPKGMLVDHANQNTLDNRRRNLRLATPSQNSRNKKLDRDSTSGYKGVSFNKEKQLYTVGISVERGKRISPGQFKSKVVAARIYDEAAIKYYGEFAKTNFKQTK